MATYRQRKSDVKELNWLNYVTAIGSIATPLLVIVLTAVGWKIRTSIERRVELEDKLRSDRIEIYNEILEPFIILLMSDTAWESDKRNKGKDKTAFGVSKMLSLDYRRTGFRLSLIGSDEVVRAYNNLMQYFFTMEENIQKHGDSYLQEGLVLLGKFLVEIRKSMGNESTKLDGWDMCEWWITDARKYRHTTKA